MGADGRGGGVCGGGYASSTEKKLNFYLKQVGFLVHSRITFYVYEKIGQVNGGGRPLESATATVNDVIKVRGQGLKARWQGHKDLKSKDKDNTLSSKILEEYLDFPRGQQHWLYRRPT